jgi:hypothetical protein
VLKDNDNLIIPPLRPRGDDEKVLVERIHEDLEEIYNRVKWLQAKIGQLRYQASMTFNSLDEDTRVEFETDYARVCSEYQFREREFWFKVGERYNLWGYPSIGVREGYCIVAIKPPAQLRIVSLGT